MAAPYTTAPYQTVDTLRQLFLSYVDESDSSFLTPTQVRNYLSNGYNKFQREVVRLSPDVWQSCYVAQFNNQTRLDLGSLPVKMQRVYRIGAPSSPVTIGDVGDTWPLLLWTLIPCQNLDELVRATPAAQWGFTWTGVCPFRYFMSGRTIEFNVQVTGPLAIVYQKLHTPDWTVPADPVDVLDQWGDLVAMYAAQQYSIRDGTNPQLESMIKQRQEDMANFFMQGGFDLNYGGSVNLVAGY